MYRIVATASFEKDFKKLDHAVAVFVSEKIEWLSAHPDMARFPLLHMPLDLRGIHKYRMGDYRLLFWIDHQEEIITLYRIRHRREVYQDL